MVDMLIQLMAAFAAYGIVATAVFALLMVIAGPSVLRIAISTCIAAQTFKDWYESRRR